CARDISGEGLDYW
nr:immunoglobulin heavy chain junction region [Macaca mulatta]MOV36852.1 immunoglobulin heavy chain junction region [Macaca mulatta]